MSDCTAYKLDRNKADLIFVILIKPGQRLARERSGLFIDSAQLHGVSAPLFLQLIAKAKADYV